jgi:hypothetical protein
VTPLRRLLACAAVALGATAAFGAAATLGIAGDDVGAGSAGVADCDLDQVIHVDYKLDPDPVPGVLVTQLDGCDGGLLKITLTKLDGTVVATGQATVAGATADVTFAGTVDPALIERYVVAVVTP